MKLTSKRILLAGTITVVPVFLIISGATANALELPFLNFERFTNKQELTLEEQGLNEYVDPTQFPKYYQNYNEIHFHEEGVTPEEFQELNDLLKLDQVSGEKPKAQFKVSDGETLSVEITDDLNGLREKFNQKKSERNQQKALTEDISFESTQITSVSFNSDPTDERVAQMNYYRGKDDAEEKTMHLRHLRKLAKKSKRQCKQKTTQNILMSLRNIN